MSSSRLRLTAIVLSFPFAVGMAGCSSDPASTGSVTAASCSEAASDGVRDCIGLVNAAWESCYSDTDAPCASDDAAVTAALAALQRSVERSCADGEFLSLSVDALVGRLQNSCRSEADSIAWRTYGGPHGA